MRVMLDTNVLISAAVLSSPYLLKLLDVLAERYTIVLSTYVLERFNIEKQHATSKWRLRLPFRSPAGAGSLH